MFIQPKCVSYSIANMFFLSDSFCVVNNNYWFRSIVQLANNCRFVMSNIILSPSKSNQTTHSHSTDAKLLNCATTNNKLTKMQQQLTTNLFNRSNEKKK